MEFNLVGFREVCARSGFTKKELAEIYGVSRQTIYDWGREQYAPTQLALAQRCGKTTEALLKALGVGMIPFPPTVSLESRKTRLNKIRSAILDALKPDK